MSNHYKINESQGENSWVEPMLNETAVLPLLHPLQVRKKTHTIRQDLGDMVVV